MDQHIKSGFFQMGGGTVAGNAVNGSAIIARAKSEEEILAVLKADIYARSGVWDLDKIRFIPVSYYACNHQLDLTTVLQFKCVYRRELIDRNVMGHEWGF